MVEDKGKKVEYVVVDGVKYVKGKEEESLEEKAKKEIKVKSRAIKKENYESK